MTADLRIGALFAGYGGLEMSVKDVLGGELAWYSEIDEAPSAILAHHNPDVPNLGDITAVDWATVEPVDVLTGGFPCTDVSAAGKRAGLTPGTRSGSDMFSLQRLAERVYAEGYDDGHRRGADEERAYVKRPDLNDVEQLRENLKAKDGKAATP